MKSVAFKKLASGNVQFFRKPDKAANVGQIFAFEPIGKGRKVFRQSELFEQIKFCGKCLRKFFQIYRHKIRVEFV